MLTSEQLLQKYGGSQASTSQPSTLGGLNSEQLLQKYGGQSTTSNGIVPPPQSKGNVAGFLEDLKNTFLKHANQGADQLSGVLSGENNTMGGQILAGANIAGEAASGAADLIFGAPLRAAFHALPQKVQEGFKQNFQAELAKSDVPKIAGAYESFKQQNPTIAQLGQDVFNIAAIIPGAKVAQEGLNAVKTEGKKAFTTLGDLSSSAGTAIKESGVNRVVNSRIAELTKLESRNATIRKEIQASSSKGIDVKKILSETDLLKGSVDKTGAIRTTQEGGAISQLNDFIKPQEQVIAKALKKEGKSIDLGTVETYLKKTVHESGLEGGALTRALKNVEDDIAGYRLKADKTDAVPLELIQNAKIDKNRNINYLNPEAARADKAIARGLKELIENNTKSVNVKALNAELAQHYAVLNLLEKLDGKIVAGGKLGKYFSTTIGAIAGTALSPIVGPLGPIAGAETGRAISGAMLGSKFGGTTGRFLKQSKAMQEALKP